MSSTTTPELHQARGIIEGGKQSCKCGKVLAIVPRGMSKRTYTSAALVMVCEGDTLKIDAAGVGRLGHEATSRELTDLFRGGRITCGT